MCVAQTFFLYLSSVDEGGETSFPGLGLAVKPARGKALLWPSVYDDNLENIDQRTIHEAKPGESDSQSVYICNGFLDILFLCICMYICICSD